MLGTLFLYQENILENVVCKMSVYFVQISVFEHTFQTYNTFANSDEKYPR